MEVFQTEKFYIFVRKETSLWWNRTTSEFTVKAGWDLSAVDDIECIGLTPGIIGTCDLTDVFTPHLVIVREATAVGALYPPHLVYKIKSVCILSDDEPDGGALQPCPRHSKTKHSATIRQSVANPSNIESAANAPKPATQQQSPKSRLLDGSTRTIWGAVKSAGNTIKNTTAQAAALASSQVLSRGSAAAQRDPQQRIERRIIDELHKMFDDTDSFYYCPDADITHNLQRRGGNNAQQTTSEASDRAGAVEPIDRDERFFWNRHMLAGVLALNEPGWVMSVIQGFVQIENCVVNGECFTLALVSRRSRHRAGTRYKRRGVDEAGNVANYVETEQILTFRRHQMAFTQVRGSVPVFWSQPGYKYRPPPRLDRGAQETQQAFAAHFAGELATYRSVYVVNLVEQGGKEKVIFDAYGDHIVRLNDERLIYVTFDFHDYCRGMRFENVSALIEAVAPEASAMGFTWSDAKGLICQQRSVFRVNCMDCLDRTNVVQTAFGKAVLESQLVKVGLVAPYAPIPDALKAPFMQLWANNGDIISRQYAGTNALKGDYTRTGERKFSGLMKDGMNSANRYYIQHFDDAFRQGVIDLMHGHLCDATMELNGGSRLSTVWEACQRNVLQPIERTVAGAQSRALQPFVGGDVWLTQNVLMFGRFVQHRATSSASSLLSVLSPVRSSVSYYLARFKDAYRQATIDLMLGNHVSAESLAALGGPTGAGAAGGPTGAIGSAASESDALESAEHARLLVEDCRRMLLGAAQYPIGAWGLIDADPNTGDPNETEVDSILLLTDELYLIAEYDSHLDKIVRFEKVPLSQITAIEFGLAAVSSASTASAASKMFHSSATAVSYPCVRLNYAVDDVDGYFHQFRSPNIRFFNNMALVIRTQDEVVESLTAIVECFRIGLLTMGRDDILIQTSLGVLQRRKSRTPLLDVPTGMPRNHSESQLLQIGSKALSNVAGQFSKLGQSLVGQPQKSRAASASAKTTANQNESPAKRATTSQITYSPSTTSLEIACVADEDACVTFTLGNDTYDNGSPSKDGTSRRGSNTLLGSATAIVSGEYDSGDDASSAYEANVNAIATATSTLSSVYNDTAFLPSVGIVMADASVECKQQQQLQQQQRDLQLAQQAHSVKRSADVCTMSISSVTEHVSIPPGMLDCGSPDRASSPAPLIRLNDDAVVADVTTGSLAQAGAQAFSHSAIEVRSAGTELNTTARVSEAPIKSQSMHNDLSLNLSGSQNESAIRQLKTLTSPLSKLATGMKSFGMNLDPRKMNLKSPIGSSNAPPSSGDAAGELPPSRSELSNQRLQEQWDASQCKTKLIAL